MTTALRCLAACLLVGLVCAAGWTGEDVQSGTTSNRKSAIENRKSPASRADGFSYEKFVRGFGSGREDVRRRLLAEVLRRYPGNPRVPDAIGEAVDNARAVRRVTDGVLLAVQVLGRLDGPTVTPRLVSFLSDPDLRLVMTTVGVLAGRGDASAIEPLAELSERTEFGRFYGLRHAVVTAMGEFREARSVEFLVDLMPEIDGQLKFETARQLRRLTGENFGGKSEDWHTWWERSRADLDGVLLAAPMKQVDEFAPMPWDHELPDFFSIEIYARQMVFVIDSSKSMLSTVNDETRLQRIQIELRQAIEELPEYTDFEVIAFNQGILRWRGKLVPATEANKQDAYRFIRALTAEQKTACYEALRAGLGDYPDAEALIFLTDGHPTAGAVIDPDKIVELISEANRFRRLSINTVGLDSRDEELEFLRTLAKRNFGKFGLMR
jgi:hypothetical protein